VQQASSILAAQAGSDFVECVTEVGRAMWADEEVTLQTLGAERGCASEEQTGSKLAAGSDRRAALKHYSGAMFYYGGEWYWGVDRLYHLEKRLASLGADRQPGQPMIIPRPDADAGKLRDTGSLTLEVYASLRSPYTPVAFDRAVKLSRDTGIKLAVRPVLPMVMRGVPATREKGMYIFMDAARGDGRRAFPTAIFTTPSVSLPGAAIHSTPGLSRWGWVSNCCLPFSVTPS